MSFKDNIKYCSRCLMPETQEGVSFDDLGICTACQSSEDKMHIDWSKREKTLKKILSDAKKKSGNKVMTYMMVKKTIFVFPTEHYLNIIKRGYKDCQLDTIYLKKALKL